MKKFIFIGIFILSIPFNSFGDGFESIYEEIQNIGDVIVGYNFTDVISVDYRMDKNTIEIVHREKSNSMYACSPPRPVPDKIEKVIYGVIDGKIVEIKRIKGQHIPSHFIEEKFEFPGDDK